jgi:hypothetical protein
LPDDDAYEVRTNYKTVQFELLFDFLVVFDLFVPSFDSLESFHKFSAFFGNFGNEEAPHMPGVPSIKVM